MQISHSDVNLPTDRSPFQSHDKMLWNIDRLAQLRVNGDTFPISVEVNPTNFCNQACRWCISMYSHLANPSMTADERDEQIKDLDERAQISNHPERRRGIDFPYLTRFLKEARELGLRSITWSGGGEPTSYRKFVDGVEYAASVELEQGLMTNGLFPKRYVPVIGNTLKWVRISLDTLDPQKYEFQKFTKGFPEVMRNIELLVEQPVKLGVNMNIADWNSDEINSMALWARDAGVDYLQIRPILGLPFEMKHNESFQHQVSPEWVDSITPALREAEECSTDDFRVIVSWDKFADVRDTDGDFGRSYRSCLSHYFVCVLNADGSLCVCMYHLGDDRFTFGNIYDNTVSEIWNSEKRRRALDMCKNNLDLATCQVCCKGHEINKFMHFIETPNQHSDVHFI